MLLRLVIVFVLLFPVGAFAHPGRTDKDGCHIVQKKWVSKDGKRAYDKGTRHCHKVGENVILGVDHVVVEEDDGQGSREGQSKVGRVPKGK